MKRRLKPWSKWSTPAKAALLTVAGLLIIWLSFSPRVFPRIYANKLFYPNLRVVSDSALTSFNDVPNRQVNFTVSDGSVLRGWYFAKPGATKIILFHQGNSGNIPSHLSLVQTFLESGCSVFIYEPRGFGKSQGRPTIRHIVEDGLAAFDLVRDSLHFTNKQIIVYGASLGASVAAHVAVERDAAGVIIQSGFASLPRIAREKVAVLKIYPDWMFPRPEFNNAKLLAKAHPPLLILHGEKDDLISVQHAKIVYQSASKPSKLVLLPNSGHNKMDPADIEMFARELNAFVSSL